MTGEWRELWEQRQGGGQVQQPPPQQTEQQPQAQSWRELWEQRRPPKRQLSVMEMVGEGLLNKGINPENMEALTEAQQRDLPIIKKLDNAFQQIPGAPMLSELAAAGNRSLLGMVDFFGPDTINAILNVAGSQQRVPTLQETMGSEGGFMEPGLARDVVQAGGETAPMALAFGQLLRTMASKLPAVTGGESVGTGVLRQAGKSKISEDVAGGVLAGAGAEIGKEVGGETGSLVGGLATPIATAWVAGKVKAVAKNALPDRPRDALAVHGEREFGIPLTEGQRTLSDRALSFEDRARSGALGDKSQNIMRKFETEQQLPALGQAKDDLVNQIAPGTDDIVRPSSAGAVIKQSVNTAEQAADRVVQEAYASVGDAALQPKAINGLYNATRKAVIGYDKDRTLKSTASLLRDLKRSQTVFVELGKAGARIGGKHIKELETMRRRLGSAIGSAENPIDKRQLVQMKNAFDEYLDDAVRNSLFKGDEGAMAAMQEARVSRRRYAELFQAQTTKTKSGFTEPDRAGRFIEKIVASNPTDEEVINALFGANNIATNGGLNLAKRLKAIVGEGEAWNTVRKAGLLRLIKTYNVNGGQIVSGGRTLKAIENALEKNNKLMHELYSPEEIGTLLRFATHAKRLTPDLVKSRENPSGTAQALTKNMGDLLRRLPLLSGDLSVSLTAGGVHMAKGLTNAAKTKRAIRPFKNVVKSPIGRAGLIEQGREIVIDQPDIE